MALLLGLAACGGRKEVELEPGVREIVNGHGRFLFLDREAWKRKGSAGLGMRIGPHELGLELLEVFEGGPAARAGLKPGLVISSVDGTPAAGLDPSAGAALIRGRPGSPIVLRLIADGRPQSKTIRRDDRYSPFADFPEGIQTRTETRGGRSCASKDDDGCLLILSAGTDCHYSCER